MVCEIDKPRSPRITTKSRLISDNQNSRPRSTRGDKFELVFKNLLENLFVERMDQNEEIFVRFMNDVPFQRLVTTWMASEAYRRLRSDDAGGREEYAKPNQKNVRTSTRRDHR